MANRLRKPTNVTLDPALLDELDSWIERQPIRMGRSSVIEAAIRAFLRSSEAPAEQRARKSNK